MAFDTAGKSALKLVNLPSFKVTYVQTERRCRPTKLDHQLIQTSVKFPNLTDFKAFFSAHVLTDFR